MNLTREFLDSIQNCKGMEEDSFVASHAVPASVSIRLNPLKITSHALGQLDAPISNSVAWCPNGYYLRERPVFTLDPMFHAGAYYVQEASSMFIHFVVEHVMKDRRNALALDLCAAPGGKSTLLSSLPQFRLVLANEIIQSRVPALVENVVKWGGKNLVVSNNDPAEVERLGAYFDLVLVDAPCSGSGLFRKDPNAIMLWKPDLPAFCAVRQQRILSHAMKNVKPGGFLVYSTCSYAEVENEANLDSILSGNAFKSIELEIPEDWGVVACSSPKHGANGYRFYPYRLGGEGFFCAVFQKVRDDDEGSTNSGENAGKMDDAEKFKQWIDHRSDYQVVHHEGTVYLQSSENWKDITMFRKLLRLKRTGIRLGNMIRGELVPDHELAVSVVLGSQVPRVQLERTMAIQFLKRETLELSGSADGWSVAEYKNQSLGWIKTIRGRCKGHYPMHWRIRM